MSEQPTDNPDRPTCDHRECRPNPNPAVAKYEGIDPPAGTIRFWACPEHSPEGWNPLKRVDPGPENRSLRTGGERADE